MITPEDIVAGGTYTCNFVLKEMPLDRYGRPGGMYSLADLPIDRFGDYHGNGYIVARDLNTKLFKVHDERLNKTFVVPFDGAFDITKEE